MSFQEDMQRTESRFRFGTSIFSSMIHPFTRVGFGRNYFGFQSLFGILALWLFTAQTSRDAVPCLIFTAAWIIARNVSRYRYYLQGWGQNESSHYNGLPKVCLDGNVSENAGKLLYEPLVAGSLSFLILCFVNESLGLFLMFSTACSVLEHLNCLRGVNAMVEQMRDAEIQQQIVFDEHERRYGR